MIHVDNNFNPSSCPLCGSGRVSRVGKINYQKPTYFSSNEILLLQQPLLARCKNCGSAFVKNIVHDFDAVRLYSSGNSSERWKASALLEESKSQAVIKILDSLFKSGKSVLDIGCNTGELLDYAQGHGCKTSGVEYSRESVKYIQLKGHEAFSSIENVKGKFDLVMAFDLVEHLYDVSGFLEKCYSLLSVGGQLVILTGDINSRLSVLFGSKWWYVSFPEHVVFPSKMYFRQYTKFEISHWIKTHHSKEFQISKLAGLRYLISSLIKKHSLPVIPPFDPDHVLIVLERVNEVA